MNDSPNRDVAVFTGALQLPVAERAAYLDRACGDNRELRQKVEALLAGYDQAGDFLEHSPQRPVIGSRLEIPAGEKPGDRIGRYKLLQQIGEGGCGVVFMAEQEEPVRRRVALKIIKPGMDTKSVIARFEAERQALALMDHPNIARIFDAGATASGRPYFVMELVRGVKITEYCDQHSLSTEERLKLFIQVCKAVQHAHQKGVIHRDIKPSNILVTTTTEGSALPVVIDFGIAKATTNQQLTDKTLFTAFEMLIGTPAYMSPEQAQLTSVDVDTRTDIYSLGVLLYELLTGSTPFDTGTLLKSGLDEIRRVIREKEPARPSTRLSKMTRADLTTIAQHRKVDPPALIHSVRGDLDWIAMKALEKDRARRYESAYGMALDIQRYLANEPISARPPSRLYKLQKTILRNKLLSLSISAITLFLFLSLVVVSIFLARERQARREAESASVKSRQVTKFLEDMLSGVGPSVALGHDTTMLREILDRTAAQVGRELTNQPAVEAELRDLIGQLYREIGDSKKAEEMDRAALAVSRRYFGDESKETATALNDLGYVMMSEDKWADGEKADEEALAIRRRILGNENADTATSLNDLGALYRQDGRLPEAESMVREALRIRQKLFGNENLPVSDSLRDLSIILGDESKWAEAEAMTRQVLTIRMTLLGTNDPSIAGSLNDLAWAVGAQGKLGEAEKLERQALAMRQNVLGADHPDLAVSLYLVGDRMRQRGDLSDADSVLISALTIQRKVLDPDNPDLLYTLQSLGTALEGEGKWSDAEPVYREALAGWRKHGGEDDPRTLDAKDKLADSLEGQGKWSEAESLRRETLAAWRKLVGDGARASIYSLEKLAQALDQQGRFSEAEPLRREAVAAWLKQARDDDDDLEALFKERRLAQTLEGEKKWPEAEAIWRDSLAKWRKRADTGDKEPMFTLRSLGLVLESEGKWPEAEAVQHEALGISRQQGGNEGPEALSDLERLVRDLVPQQKYAEAEHLLDAELTPEFVKQSASGNLVIERIGLYGRQGKWPEAVTNAALALAVQPGDHYRYHTLNALLAVTRTHPAYEQMCRKMFDTFTNTQNPYIDERIVQDCLLLPDAGIDLQALDKLAEAAVTNGNGSDDLPYFQACKAMSDYRLGHFPEAIEWADKATNSSKIYAQAKAYAILAMADWQLGQKNSAPAMLAKGNALTPPISSFGSPVNIGESWVAWLMARISLDEAATLIQTAATSGPNPAQP